MELGELQRVLARKITEVSNALDSITIGKAAGDFECCEKLVSLAEQLVRVHMQVNAVGNMPYEAST